MSTLRNPKHEKFARELAEALNEGILPSEAVVIAGRAADYPEGRSVKTFAANCRKRAQREDIARRVDELRAPGIARAEEELAITTEYLLAKLDNLTNYNVDDYLTQPDKRGQRFLDVSRVPRSVLSRLSEISQESRKGKGGVVLTRTKIKGYSVIDGIRLMAQIKGYMAPEKRDVTVHTANQMTDDELARIAAGGSEDAAPAPASP